MRPLRILVVGSSSPLGGTSVLLRQLLAELGERDDVRVSFVDSAGAATPRAALALLVRVLPRLAGSDVVSLHASSPGLGAFAWPLHLLCRLLRKPLVLRQFGGSLDLEWPELSAWARFGLPRALRGARLVLIETHLQLDYVREHFPGARLAWYSNSRPVAPPEPPRAPHPARRFVYIGHVKPSKGLRELAEAAGRLASLGCSVDVYGPFLDGLEPDDLAHRPGLRYGGVLPPERVIETLRQHDVVVLPTWHFGEGYPGILLEAYSAGRPVVTTRWRALPEIVEDGASGLLIEPRDVDALERAMRSLAESPERLAHLEAGARRQAERFDSRRWTERFVELCREAADRQA